MQIIRILLLLGKIKTFNVKFLEVSTILADSVGWVILLAFVFLKFMTKSEKHQAKLRKKRNDKERQKVKRNKLVLTLNHIIVFMIMDVQFWWFCF